jgi:Domain of unknown function (DUF6468)
MDFRVLLDLIIAVLLVVTIGYCMTLNNRLTALRRNRDQMSKIIASFNEATLRAESSIPKLRRAADEAGNGLQERVEKAQSLRDDLAFMIERADTMANRLENSVRTARTEVRNPQSSGPAPTPRAQWSGSGPGPAAPTAIAPAAGPVFGRMAQPPAAGSDFGRMAPPPAAGSDFGRMAPPPAAATYGSLLDGGDDDEGGQDDRSEAERELLRALQAMR